MSKEVYSALNKRSNSLYDVCFDKKEDPEMVKSYFKTYFNLISKQDFSLLTFYNYVDLPYYLCEQTYNGFFHKNISTSKDDLINILTEFYFGNSEKRSDLVFAILDTEQNGKLHINNVISMFNGFINVDRSFSCQSVLEDIGKDVIRLFFSGKEQLTFDEYKKTLQESNSDLFYLFYMFYRHYAFFSFSSIEHFKNKFHVSKNNTKTKELVVNRGTNEDCSCTGDTRTFSNKTNVFFILSPPSDTLLDFFNKKFNYDFEIDCDLRDLDTFEGELNDIRACLSNINNNNIFTHKKLRTNKSLVSVYPRDFIGSNYDKFFKAHAPSKRSNNTVPHLYMKALIDNESLRTFKVEWLSGDNYLPYNIDIIANDVYIYNKDKQLKLLFPIQHLYIETTNIAGHVDDNSDDNSNDDNDDAQIKRFPISLYSELNNNLKQCILFFDNFDDRENFLNLIIQRTKFDTFDKTRFDNQTKIDNGSFGQIIKAYDKILKREVAIKLINKPRGNRETIKMIRNEQDICQFLQKEHFKGIIEIFEINETKDNVYIIEELIHNGNLKEYLLLNHLDEKEKITIMKQLALSIQFLHKNGIVHRDLKLENILIDKRIINDNVVLQTKINDFGLSTFFLGNHKMKDKYGTLLYLPPEIVLNHSYTKKLDIWDFGIIAFTILNDGEHPFAKETEVQDLLQKIINKDIDYKHIDNKFHPILNGCLQKENQRKDIDEIIEMINSLDVV